jgi:hypothetical protein
VWVPGSVTVKPHDFEPKAPRVAGGAGGSTTQKRELMPELGAGSVAVRSTCTAPT